MTAVAQQVLRELAECADGRASGNALRLAVKLGAGDWYHVLLELEERALVVEDRRAPGVIVLTAIGLRQLAPAVAA